jgi:mono/diheme cytochrome c family protein
MNTARMAAALAALGTLGLLTDAGGADKSDFGKREYDAKCAVCHGAAGKGDGPYAGEIKARIPDITTVARRNGGVFPLERVQAIIDGRQALKSHGPRDMPIWGNKYLTAAAETYTDHPYDTDFYVRMPVLALTDYIYRLQVK